MEEKQKKQTRQLLTRLRPPQRRNPADSWTAEGPEEEKYAQEHGQRGAYGRTMDWVAEQQPPGQKDLFRSMVELDNPQGLSPDQEEPMVPYSREYVGKLSRDGETPPPEELPEEESPDEIPTPEPDEDDTGIMSLRRRQPRKRAQKK